ncbi:MAG: hypothetical protein ICV83_23640 [Cytophagales bacterium]|nr:hypothetical protein [Cytophagales bacterium]
MKALLRVLLLPLLFPFCCNGQDVAPPTLVYPTNGDTIQALFPVLSWTAAYPLIAGKGAGYRVRMVEVLGNQTPEAAMQANPDWFSQGNIAQNVLAYPVSAPLLRQNKRYAWQVSAQFQEGATAGEQVTDRLRTVSSEVYDFVLRDNMSDEACIPFLFEKLDERFYVFNDYDLKFKLGENTPKADALRYRITDPRGNDALGEPVRPVLAEGGHYSVPLRKYEAFRRKSAKGKFYFLEATSTEGRTYKLKFACN